MAINKITAPGSTPATFWPAVLEFFEAYALGIENAFRVKSTAHIAKGSFFAIGGSIYVADSDTAITGTSSAYVKLTPSGTTASPSYVASLTGVTWSDTYNGYYDGSGNLYIFDEVVARNAGAITELKTTRNWKGLNTAVIANRSANSDNSDMINSLNMSTGKEGTYSEVAVNTNSTVLIPAGTYMVCTKGFQSVWLEIKDGSGTWQGGSSVVNGLIISDGVNFRFRNITVANYTVCMRRLA